jgi:putative addiction module killer protein
MPAYEIRHYRNANGTDVFGDWFDGLADRQARARIAARIERLELGLFGDAKSLREGVWELRIDCGPGYRVYYALFGRAVLLLLCGGDKSGQRGDIARAVAYWQEWQGQRR